MATSVKLPFEASVLLFSVNITEVGGLLSLRVNMKIIENLVAFWSLTKMTLGQGCSLVMDNCFMKFQE